MNLVSVQSSDLRAVGYDAISNTLQISFISGGTYLYSNVPSYIYQNLLTASSKGKYFAEYIKDTYPHSKL